MAIQIRIGGNPLTPEQEQQEELYYKAAKFLRSNGFPDAYVIKLVVLRPDDPVARISLEPF